MKKLITILTLSLSMSGAFAHGYTDGQLSLMLSFGTSFVPSEITGGSFESSSAGTYGILGATSSRVQARGVAGKEQLMDELVLLNDDMNAGRVRTLEEVRQPALKELLLEIKNDQIAAAEIKGLVSSGSELSDLALGLSISLLNN